MEPDKLPTRYLLQRREMLKAMAAGIGLAPCCFRQLPAAEQTAKSMAKAACVASLQGVPTFVVGDSPLRTATFETYAPRQRYFEQFAKAGTEVFGFNTNAAACDYGHSRPTWLDDATWNYSHFEERAAMVLAACPPALLLPRVNLTARNKTWVLLPKIPG